MSFKIFSNFGMYSWFYNKFTKEGEKKRKYLA